MVLVLLCLKMREYEKISVNKIREYEKISVNKILL